MSDWLTWFILCLIAVGLGIYILLYVIIMGYQNRRWSADDE